MRKPIGPVSAESVVEPEPAVMRSPSLAANAQLSTQPSVGAAVPATSQQDTTAIFGSVAALDVLTRIREALLADNNGSRVALEVDGVTIRGLEAGEDRIKSLGLYEVEIITGKGLEPVKRTIEVVPEMEPTR